MSSPKILFTDLDGTLLNDQKQITPGNYDAIREALSHGHKIVLSTGRALGSAKKQAEVLGLTMPGCYLIAFNGGCIYNICEQKILYEKTIPLEYVYHLFKEAEKFGLHIQTYDADSVLALKETKELLRYAANTSMDYRILSDLETELKDAPQKVLSADFESRILLDQYAKSLKDWAKGKVDLFYSCPEYLEIVPPEVSKGKAVLYLCNLLNIPLSQTMSAGDAENDISMLQTTPVSIVMKNAPEFMRQYGTYITSNDNNHDGIAEAIRRFML